MHACCSPELGICCSVVGVHAELAGKVQHVVVRQHAHHSRCMLKLWQTTATTACFCFSGATGTGEHAGEDPQGEAQQQVHRAGEPQRRHQVHLEEDAGLCQPHLRALADILQNPERSLRVGACLPPIAISQHQFSTCCFLFCAPQLCNCIFEASLA